LIRTRQNFWMIQICLQTLMFVVASSTLAQSQPNISSTESFIKPTAGLVKELESGLSRIQKNCGELRAPTFDNGYPTDGVLEKIKNSNIISEAEIKKVNAKVSTSLQLLRDQTPPRCRLPLVTVFDSACKGNETFISKIKNIETDAQILYKETVDRYRLYVLSIQLENSNCTRAGFASKLWRTEEHYIQPGLLRFSGFFIQQIDDLLSKP
jgi:hypothetical protein